jgi:sialate O-acetylesterase
MKRIASVLFVFAAMSPAIAAADVLLPEVLADHMVLQRDRSVPIWGHAEPGEAVTISFRGNTAQAVADARGEWSTTIASGPASSVPEDLTVAGKNRIQLHDVLVGEVWICSGQSNMEYPMKRTNMNGTSPPPAGTTDVAAELCATVHEPEIRLLRVERKLNQQRLPTDGWHPALPGEAFEHFSAPGFFFGRDLHAALKVPIGLIESAWAGSRIEPWIAPGALEQWGGAELKRAAATMPGRLDGSPVGNYYVKLVQPLAPFSVRGVIWYQGESNIITGNDGMRYVDKLRALVEGWRSAWHDPGMALIQVQIAPFLYSRRKDPLPHTATALPEFWEAQRAATTSIPHVGLVDITDLADSLTNIHPWNKWDVGHRLALWALANEYGQKEVVFSGPLYQAMTVNDGKAIIRFQHSASGLQSRDGKPLTDFEVAGEDGKFVPASATIEGQTVVVSSPAVPAPKAVHFAWREDARPNLMNKEGLPAEPFRTDGTIAK